MSAIILDAAMGTRLIDLGFKLTTPLWSATILSTHPEAVIQIHKENIAAGAQVITTNTFRTTPYAFHKAGLSGVDAHTRARALTLLAIRLAWKTIKESGQDVKIAGAIAPLADSYRPEDYPGNIAARPWHDAQLDNLSHQSTDILLAETMNSAREARLIAELALRYDKPVWVSFTLNKEGQILNGDDLVSTAQRLEKMGVSAVGVNCSDFNASKKALQAISQAVSIPLIVYPNLGHSHRTTGKISDRISPEQFLEWTLSLDGLGIEVIGACCGSSADHIKALSTALVDAD